MTNPEEILPDSQESFSDFWVSQYELRTFNMTNDDCMDNVDLSQIIDDCQTSTTERPVNSLLSEDCLPLPVQTTHNGFEDFAAQAEINNPVSSDDATAMASTVSVSLKKFPGAYGFETSFGPKSDSATKCATSYSHNLEKWFVKIGETCPVFFKCDKNPPPKSIIRAVPVFTQSEHMMRVVTRCINHKMDDKSSHIAPSHLVRAEMPLRQEVCYCVDQDGRESVTTLYEPPHVGSDTSIVLYKFMCNSSCPSGINRHPIAIVFTLEDGNLEILGRSVVDIRISTCPGRDRSLEEVKAQKKMDSSFYKRPIIVKRQRDSEVDDELFHLTVKGRENYEMLKKIKIALELQSATAAQTKEEVDEQIGFLPEK